MVSSVPMGSRLCSPASLERQFPAGSRLILYSDGLVEAISPDGDRAVLTARGRIFVAPHRHGRLVEVTQQEGVRNRNARFMPDGETLVALSEDPDIIHTAIVET